MGSVSRPEYEGHCGRERELIMATSYDNFYKKPCEKMDAQCIDASFELALDDINESILHLYNSWEDTAVDLEDAVKDAETVTHMFLSPTDNPIYLEHDNEAGEHECILGDDLARIIPMKKLKDVDQTDVIEDGEVYMYDEDSEKFKPFDLQEFVDTTNSRLTSLESRMTVVEAAIVNINSQLAQIWQILTPPSPIPDGTKLVWGNINLYSDNTNSNLKTSGLYTHGTDINVTNDEYFS